MGVFLMILYRIFIPFIFVLLVCEAAVAGPCTAEIDKTQARIDAALDRQAGAGNTAAESTAATAHHQPTPETIAAAEKALGEGASIRDALAALEIARAADAQGDAAGCRAAILSAQKALKL
jgi:hypothetical protein